MLELIEGMINGSYSLLSDIVSNVCYEHKIVNAMLMGELIFDGTYLLSGEEDSRGVEKKIESML